MNGGNDFLVKRICLPVLIFGLLGYIMDFQLFPQDTCTLGKQERIQRWQKLEKNVSREIFGQHIAVDVVLRTIFAHITNEEPRKALVMSFHGSVGSGKTFMSQLIAKNLYEGGFDSPYVTTFVGPLHFFQDETKLAANQEMLKEKIKGAAQNCNKGLFIFDEVDKMPPQIFNAIVPFLDYYDVIDGIDYRGLIFIFLSNTGSYIINQLMYDLRVTAQKPREEIAMEHFGPKISEGAFKESGGLFRSEMIQRRLIDYYVPFLPLELHHVLMCVRRDIVKRRVHFIPPEKVASQIQFLPAGKPIFAKDGCKRVLPIVNFYETDSTYHML